MTQASYYEYANVHRGLHYLANAATDNYEGARESVRAFLNAASTDEIVFTKSATEAINLVASSFGREHIQEGSEIVLTILEHHANIVPWHFLRESKGAVLKWVDCDDEGVITAEDVIAAISPKTKLIALTQMSNVNRHRPADQGDRRGGPRARYSGAGRRLAGGRPPCARHAGPRRRFLRDDRPQAVRTDRHRRAVREKALARAFAALPRRRRDDRGGDQGWGHLQRPAAPLRGWYAADPRGSRARCGTRLHDEDRPRSYRRARSGAGRLRDGASSAR